MTPYRAQLINRNYNIEFDEGHLKWDLAAAEAEVEANMAIMTDTHPTLRMEDNKLRWIFQLCWFRLKKVFFPISLCFVLNSIS